MLTYKKNDGVKLIDPESKLSSVLEADGWVLEEEKPRKKKSKAKTNDDSE